MRIINPPFSFIQFEPVSRADYIIPVFQENETWFSVIVSCDTMEEAQQVFYAPRAEMQLLLLRGHDNNPVSMQPQTIRNYTTEDSLYFRKYKVSYTDVMFVWSNDLKRVITNDPLIECRECFQLGLIFRNIRMVSPPLIKICDDTDTAMIRYYGDDNSFGFTYCNADYENKIRVPMLLNNPQIKTEESIYVRSNGVRKVNKSVKTKEYNCHVDFSDISFHERLDAALSHDNVYIQSRNYTGNAVRTGDYEIDWDGAKEKYFAQAECAVLVTPYNAKNSNCGSCRECTPVSITARTPPIANSNDGSYEYFINVTGDGPFLIQNVTKPDWITISEVTNGKIRVYGDPPAANQTEPISFEIYNCYGINRRTYNSNIRTIYIDVWHEQTSNSSADIFWTEVEPKNIYHILIEQYTGANTYPNRRALSGYPKRVETNEYSKDGLTSLNGYRFSVRVVIGNYTSKWVYDEYYYD